MKHLDTVTAAQAEPPHLTLVPPEPPERAWPRRVSLRALARVVATAAVALSLAAASIACLTAALAGRPLTWAVALLPFLCTFCVYNVDRLVEAEGTADGQSSPARTRMFRRRRRRIRACVAAAFVAMVAIAAGEGARVLLLTLAFPLSGALYVMPVLPGRRIRRLKDIPLLKCFYVPACWCLLVALVIQLCDLSWRAPTTLFCVGFVYLRIFLGAYIGDLRDVESDRLHGVKTLAVQLGSERSYRLLYALHAGTLFLLPAAVFVGWAPIAALALVPCCLIGWSTLVLFRRRVEDRERLCEVYDLEYIAYWPLVFLASCSAPGLG